MRSRLSNTKFSNIDLRDYVVYIAFVIIFIIFSITLRNRGFVSTYNLINILRQTAMVSVMAVGMTFVISSGEIDLSVGAVAAFSAMTSALVLQEFGIIAAVLVGLGTGFSFGALNGLLVTKLSIPSFLVTLGTMGISRGAAMWITGTAAVPILNNLYSNVFGIGTVAGIPVMIFWSLLIVLIGYVLLNKSTFGRKTLAIGGNEKAALFSGIHTLKIKFWNLTMLGFLSGFAGILYSGRMGAARFSIAEGAELSVIAAVILGGTSLSGGTGSVLGALFGSLLMGMINNGLIIMGLDISQQMVVRGIIIILAVAFGQKKTKE